MSKEPKNELAVNEQKPLSMDVLSKLVLRGDLSGLDPKQKMDYYVQLCTRLGLDAATQPLSLITLQGKEVFYAGRSCCQQLSALHKVSHKITSRDRIGDIYVVTAQASQPDGRSTESTGAVDVQGLKGQNLANALMKTETKAKRRATLDLVGLGLLDESEVDVVPTDLSSLVAGGSAATPQAPADANAALQKLKDAMNVAGMKDEWVLNTLRETKLIDETVTKVEEIPVGVLENLVKPAWLSKFVKKFNDEHETGVQPDPKP